VIAIYFNGNVNTKSSGIRTIQPTVESTKLEGRLNRPLGPAIKQQKTSQVVMPITENHPEVKLNPKLIIIPAIDPKNLPSLEEFKKAHPEVKVTIEKLNKNEMFPGLIPTKEQFIKNHPEAKIRQIQLENNKMIPPTK
jgi:hypothetical protein